MEYLNINEFVHDPKIKAADGVSGALMQDKNAMRTMMDAQAMGKVSTELDKQTTKGAGKSSVLDEHLSKMMGDAPFCNLCGHITVRNGACYKCLNCGNTMGCS